MFQWQASEATSAIRLWKDPKLWVSWKLNSAQEWWHTVKRRQKYLLLLISWFCPSGLLYIIVILGAAMHKFDLWLCCCMAGWLRWQAVSVIVDRSSPTKHRLCYSMILAWWSSWVVQPPLQIFAHFDLCSQIVKPALGAQFIGFAGGRNDMKWWQPSELMNKCVWNAGWNHWGAMLSALASALSAGLGIVARILICKKGHVHTFFRPSQHRNYISIFLPSKHYRLHCKCLDCSVASKEAGKRPCCCSWRCRIFVVGSA